MNELYIKDFAIEVTRRCNMTCTHCLRGDSQDLYIEHRDIHNVLKHVKHIKHFNITGGEPSLNTRAIRYILKQLRHFGITVSSFDIVTNGSLTSASKAFIEVCSELFDYQENKDQSEFDHMLCMSDDRFHNHPYRDKAISILSNYPFFGLRGQTSNIFLFREGRCNEGFPNPIHPIYLTEENGVYGDVYLNAEGMVLSNGNLSYQRQRENTLCHSLDFLKYLEKTLRERKASSLYSQN